MGWVLLLLLIAEIFLIVLYCVSLFFFWRIVFKRKIFNINLFVLLVTLPCTGLFILVPRPIFEYLIATENYRDSLVFKLIGWLHGTGLFANAFDLFNFVAERCFATAWVSSYEGVRRPTISLVLLSCQWISSGILVAWAEFGDGGELSTIILFVICGVAILSSTVVFLILPRIALRVHDRVIREQGLDDFSKRYQSVENVRSARMLNRLIIFMVVALSLLLFFFTYIQFRIPPSDQLEYFRLFYCLDAIHLITALVIVICFHPKLLEEGRSLFGLKSAKISGVVSISGRQLDIDVSAQRDVYFNSYAQSWNSVH